MKVSKFWFLNTHSNFRGKDTAMSLIIIPFLLIAESSEQRLPEASATRVYSILRNKSSPPDWAQNQLPVAAEKEGTPEGIAAGV